MRSHLLLLWLCTLGIVISDGSPVGEADVLGDVATVAQTGLGVREGDLHARTVLVDMGVGKDGCTGAYNKFKAGIKKVEGLKTKAEKKANKAAKAQKKAEGLLKNCKGNQKEILQKATWKKAKIDRKIKTKAKSAIDKFKKKAKAKAKAAKKKVDATLKSAKKKAADSTRKMKSCKSKAKKTKKSLKAKYKQKIRKFKATHKAAMAKKVKLEIADGMVRKTREVKKKEKKAFEDKLKKIQKKATADVSKCTKAKILGLRQCKQDSKERVAKAGKSIPAHVTKKIAKLESGLKEKTKTEATCKKNLRKKTAALKDTKEVLGGKYTKEKVKAKDCHKREKALQRDVAGKRTKIKTDAVKLEDKDREIQRLKDKLKLLSTKLSGAKQLVKAKHRKKKMVDAKLKHTSDKLTETEQELKSLRTKMTAGEGALMGEISRNKKTINSERDRGAVLGNKLAKNRLNHKKTLRKLNRCTLKKRELGQSLYNCKRDVNKWQTKFETLTMAHTTTTQRLRDTRSKYELSVDKVRDAKIKANGCAEAMNRLKTYTNDQINEQKMQLTRIRQELSQQKMKAHSAQVSQAEKAKADKMAERAATKAASQAVAKANAKALAVKADAKTAVAQAVSEAVKLTKAKQGQLDESEYWD